MAGAVLVSAGLAVFLSAGKTVAEGAVFAPTDIEELATISELVVQGEITGIAQRHREGPEHGLPFVVYEFAVNEVLGGEVGETIFVSHS